MMCDQVAPSTNCRFSTTESMKVIKKTIATNRIHRANDQSTRRPRPNLNQAVIAASEIVATHRQVDGTKNRHVEEVQAVAVTVAVTHAIRIDHESTQIDRGANGRHPMIARADRARAASNVINIREKKATPEVTATNVVDIEAIQILLSS